MNKIILPELGEGIKKATVAVLHCNIGDIVKDDQDVVEVVTDKASFNISSQYNGIVKSILVKEGEEVNIGKELIYIESGI